MRDVFKPCALSLLLAGLVACGGGSGGSSTSQPDPDPTPTPEPQQTTVIIEESDEGLCSLAGLIESEHTGYLGTGYANTTNAAGVTIVWKVEAASSVSADVTVRFANGGADDRGGVLSLDSGSDSATFTLAATGAWSSWQEETHSITLASGENTLTLTAATDAGLANIDSITLEGLELTAASCFADHTGTLLSQTGNPIGGELDNYKDWLSTSSFENTRLRLDKALADNIITWQMPHGGFYKYDVSKYDDPWNGTDARSGWLSSGVELGTIDNDATVSELLFLANVYQRTGETQYKDAANSAMDFILTMQYSTGGWPQVYPSRGNYSDYVTFNDDAMARVMLLLDKAVNQESPLNGDLFDDAKRTEIQRAINKGIDFILNAQIEQNGTKTVWCAQHDAYTYAAKPARAYELESKSGKESVLVVGILMSQPQSEAIESAVKDALAWYRSSAVQVADKAYVRSSACGDDYNPIQDSPGSTMWYRFYDLDQDVGFFSGRDGVKKYDIMEIETERRCGYQWGGDYGTALLNYAERVGY